MQARESFDDGNTIAITKSGRPASCRVGVRDQAMLVRWRGIEVATMSREELVAALHLEICDKQQIVRLLRDEQLDANKWRTGTGRVTNAMQLVEAQMDKLKRVVAEL